MSLWRNLAAKWLKSSERPADDTSVQGPPHAGPSREVTEILGPVTGRPRSEVRDDGVTSRTGTPCGARETRAIVAMQDAA